MALKKKWFVTSSGPKEVEIVRDEAEKIIIRFPGQTFERKVNSYLVIDNELDAYLRWLEDLEMYVEIDDTGVLKGYIALATDRIAELKGDYRGAE